MDRSVKLFTAVIAAVATIIAAMIMNGEWVMSVLQRVVPSTTLPGVSGRSEFKVDFSKRFEGDLATEFGPNAVVWKGGPSGELGVTSLSETAADIAVDGLSLSGKVLVSARLLASLNGQHIRLMSGMETLADLDLVPRYQIKFGDEILHYSQAGWKWGNEINEVSIAIDGGFARLNINGTNASIQRVADSTITSVEVTGLVRKQDYLFSLSGASRP